MRSVSGGIPIFGSFSTPVRIHVSLSALVVLIFFTSCTDEHMPPSGPVATIGNKVVTVDEFRQEYELTTSVNRSRFNGIEERKRAVLDNQIENVLFTVAGREKGLDRSKDVDEVLSFYEAHAVIRELYRDVVHAQIQITETELRDAFLLSGQKVYLRQFLFMDVDDARNLYERIKAGESFEDLALQGARSEQELQHLLEPVEFRWGDLDEQLELAAFGLEIQQISAPIQSRLGYHVIQLVHRTESLLQTENDYQARKETLKKIITRRREAALARKYLNSLAKNEQSGIIGSALTKLARTTREIVASESAESPVPVYQQVYLIESRIGEMKDIEIVRGASSRLTIGELLVLMKKLPPTERFDLSTTGSVTRGVATLVRDGFLAREGYALGLQTRPEVQEELSRRRDEIAGTMMRRMVLDTVQVSVAFARAYLDANRQHYQIPEKIRVREVMVRDKSTADSLYSLIISGSDTLEDLARKHSVREWARKNGGDLGFFSRGAFGSLGERAFGSSTGVLNGPVPILLTGVVSGYSVYRVLDRIDASIPSYSEIEERVYDDAFRSRKTDVLETFLADVRKRHPVRVYDDVLAAIHTTDDIGTGLPMDMMAFRRR